jgi:hypothetical protein
MYLFYTLRIISFITFRNQVSRKKITHLCSLTYVLGRTKKEKKIFTAIPTISSKTLPIHGDVAHYESKRSKTFELTSHSMDSIFWIPAFTTLGGILGAKTSLYLDPTLGTFRGVYFGAATGALLGASIKSWKNADEQEREKILTLWSFLNLLGGGVALDAKNMK